MTVDVRRAALSHLASGADSRFGRPYLVATIREQAHCADTDVWEALWGLVGDGLAYLDTAGQGSGTDNWLWRLSTVGQRFAKGGSWEPRDPDGYLDRIRREIPDLDDLVELYLTEALQAYVGIQQAIDDLAILDTRTVRRSRSPSPPWTAATTATPRT